MHFRDPPKVELKFRNGMEIPSHQYYVLELHTTFCIGSCLATSHIDTRENCINLYNTKIYDQQKFILKQLSVPQALRGIRTNG